jgi:hypothetical protein
MYQVFDIHVMFVYCGILSHYKERRVSLLRTQILRIHKYHRHLYKISSTNAHHSSAPEEMYLEYCSSLLSVKASQLQSECPSSWFQQNRDNSGRTPWLSAVIPEKLWNSISKKTNTNAFTVQACYITVIISFETIQSKLSAKTINT